ncbi:alginate export family protein [Algivirga pacifica]|uniref:Alginate export family protein n=2 Tax=Algivirga pacifica TaxID=1162670 RepID=A0ABP9CX91_9BACT
MSNAQHLKVSGQLKHRFEHRHGFKTLRPVDDHMDVAANFFVQRSRLNLFYGNQLKHISVGVSVQDVRTWGATKQLSVGDANNLGIHEAWTEINFNEHLFMKLGRQELVYDNSRILGNMDWTEQGRSHDLALFKYENLFKLHAGLAYNVGEESLYKTPFEVSGNYKEMQFLWFNKQWEHLNWSILLLNNGIEYVEEEEEGLSHHTPSELETIYSQLLGTYIEYHKNHLSINTSAYYQGGTNCENQNLRAYNILCEVRYKIDNGLSLLAGTELLSGTDMDATDNVCRAFNPLYGSNHHFNGYMDYFYVENHENSVGLADHYIGISHHYHHWDTSVETHLFNAMGNIVTEDGQYHPQLGTEIDISTAYHLSDEVAIKAGYSVMAATESMEVLKGGDAEKFNNWAWVMVKIHPTFFETHLEQEKKLKAKHH